MMKDEIDLKKVAAQNDSSPETENPSDEHWTQDFETTGGGKGGNGGNGGNGNVGNAASIASVPKF